MAKKRNMGKDVLGDDPDEVSSGEPEETDEDLLVGDLDEEEDEGGHKNSNTSSDELEGE